MRENPDTNNTLPWVEYGLAKSIVSGDGFLDVFPLTTDTQVRICVIDSIFISNNVYNSNIVSLALVDSTENVKTTSVLTYLVKNYELKGYEMSEFLKGSPLTIPQGYRLLCKNSLSENNVSVFVSYKCLMTTLT